MRVALAGGVLCAAAAGAAWAVRGRSAGGSVWRGPAHRPAVGLSFDDGPTPGTADLLDLLDEHQAKATFFLCGRSVERYPTLAREIVRRGHEAANHSYSHPLFAFRSAAFIAEELEHAQRVITEATGVPPVLFRPPFGVRWLGLSAALRRLGLTPVMWTTLGLDWKWKADAIARRLVHSAKNGAIFCLHDGRQPRADADIRETLAALRRVLPELRRRGFAIETVSHLLCPTT